MDFTHIKNEIKEFDNRVNYREVQYKRYSTEAIPIIFEENPEWLQEDVENKNKPDRRLYNHFEKEIVDTKVSFFIANPVMVSSYNQDEKLNEYVDNFNIEINYEDLFAEVTKDASSSGVGGVLLYNDNAIPNCIKLDPNEFFVYYHLKEPINAIRKYLDEEKILTVEWFDSDTVTQYKSIEGEWVQVAQELHGFRRVPIIEVVNNKERQSDYHSACKLIDAYNRLISDFSNEIESFRLAYMVLENYNATKEDLAKIRETGAITTDKEGKVYFLTKTLDTKAIEVMKNILEKNIARFAGHVSFAEDTFTGNLTEMAISFKIRPLEQKVSNYERKFKVFLRELYKTLFTFKTYLVSFDYRDLTFTFTRNLPINVKEEVENLVKLGGKLSQETILGLMSFIKNPQDEMAKLESEKEEDDEEDVSNTDTENLQELENNEEEN